MKKSCYLTFVLIWIVFVLSGCSNTAKSYHSKIDEDKINDRLTYNKISNSVHKEYLKEVFGYDYEAQYKSVILSEEIDEIKKSLIEDLMIIKCCKDNGIYVNENSATEQAKLEFKNLNKDGSQKRYVSILYNTISEYELSENEYLNLLYKEAYYKYNKQAFKKYFYENFYNVNDDKTLNQQFDIYIETLLK